MRMTSFVLATGLSVVAAGSPQSAPAPACLLLRAPDASKLMGMPVVVNPDDVQRMDFTCRYNPNPNSFDGVEITWRTFPDGNSAHAFFPRWIIPAPPKPADMTLITVPGIGDEATIVHGKIANSIFLRRGSVLVKMGTHPGASDSALKVAGKTVVSRM